MFFLFYIIADLAKQNFVTPAPNVYEQKS